MKNNGTSMHNIFLILLSVIFIGCQKGFSTYEPIQSYDSGKIISVPTAPKNGARNGDSDSHPEKKVKIKQSEIIVDSEKRKIKLIFTAESEQHIEKFELEGEIDENDEARLYPTEPFQNKSLFGNEVRAEFSCPFTFSEESSITSVSQCPEPFVDVYFKSESQKQIQREQIQFNLDQQKQKFLALEKKQADQTASPKTEDENLGQEHSSDDGHSHGEDLSEGAFVGSSIEKIEKLFTEKKEVLNSVSTTKKATSTKNNVKTTQQPKQEIVNPKTGTYRPINQAQGSVGNGRLANASSLLQKKNELGDAATFEIIRPEAKKYFGTYDLVETIHQVSQIVYKQVPGYKIRIGNMSKQRGGVVNDSNCGNQCSVTHRNGLDVDIEYILKKENDDNKLEAVVNRGKFKNSKTHLNNQKRLADQFLSENFNFFGNWLLLKELHNTGLFNVAFVHDIVKIAMCSYALATGEYKGADDKSSQAYEILRRLRPENKDHYHHIHVSLKCSSHDKNCKESYSKIPEDTDCFKYRAIATKFSSK
jgi:murein endopeptidase